MFIGKTDAEVETPILWPPHAKSWLLWKDPDARKDWRWEEKGITEDEMVGWHHRLNGHDFEQAPGVGDGQGGLECCSPWDRKESDTTEWLNWTEPSSPGLPWEFSGKESICQYQRQKTWVQSLVLEIPWRRKWQSTPVFLPGKSQTEEPGRLQSIGSQSDITERLKNKNHSLLLSLFKSFHYPPFWFRFSSVTKSCPTLCNPMNHSMPGLPVHNQLPSQWCHPSIWSSVILLPPILPSITDFSSESMLPMRWPKFWSFSFNISPSNEHPELISFRMDWLDLLAVQGTLKSPLLTPQLKSINFSVLSFLHSPTLTSIHDHWKNHSFD